jgi:hypothetical protein
MDHGAVIRNRAAALRRLAMLLVVLAMLFALPATAKAAGATLVDPVDGKHFDHLELAPMVQFDPSKTADGKTETPKWVLLASDAEMKTTVRYCRQFVWAATNGAYHWGCNRWATGVDSYGTDQLRALEAGTVYYWQVVSTGADGTSEVKSDVRSFAIDAEPTGNSVQDVSNQVYGTAFDDGTQLNLGTAAFVNSGVRVTSISSSRLVGMNFRIRLAHLGSVDLSRSYVKVTSRAGTRYLKLAKVSAHGAGTLWKLSAAERRLGTKRYSYQAFLKSRRNGAMVRSQVRVVLIKRGTRAPAWKPDRRTVKPI